MLHVFLIGCLIFVHIETGNAAFRCGLTSEGAWHSYLGGRIDEGSQYDCPAGSAGGQCVALVKCKCGVPWTGAWQADIKMTEVCGPNGHYHLEPGTVIATFDNYYALYGNRWTDHTAVFLGCTGNGVKVVEQGCTISVRIHEYSRSTSHYQRFYSVRCRSGTNCAGYPSNYCHVRMGK